MAKQKPYGKREENALLKIPAGTGNAQAFREHAKKYGRTEASVYQKHKTLHSAVTVVTPPKVKVTAIKTSKIVAVPSGNTVNMYTLETGAEVGVNAETLALRDRLRPQLEAMDVYDAFGTRHSIPVESSKVGSLRNWINAHFKGKTYSIVTQDKNVSRIIRKS